MLQYKPIHRVLFSLLLAVVLMFNGIGASASTDSVYIPNPYVLQLELDDTASHINVTIAKSFLLGAEVSDTAMLYIGFYNAQEALLELETVSLPTLAEDLEDNWFYTHTVALTQLNTTKVKAFLWLNTDTMQPLAIASELDIPTTLYYHVGSYILNTEAHLGSWNDPEVTLQILDKTGSVWQTVLADTFTIQNAWYNETLRTMYPALSAQETDLSLELADISENFDHFAAALRGTMAAYRLNQEQFIDWLILPAAEDSENAGGILTASPVQKGQVNNSRLGEYYVHPDTPVFFINGTDDTQAAPGTAADPDTSVANTAARLAGQTDYTYIVYTSAPETQAAVAVVVYNTTPADICTYGYIMGHQQDEAAASGGSDGFRLQILTPANAVQDCAIDADTTVVTADSTDPTQTVETKVSSSAELLTLLQESAKLSNTDAYKSNFDIQQVIKYNTSLSQGTLYLDKLITAAPTDRGDTLTDDRLNFYTRISATDATDYTNRRLSNQRTEILTTEDTIVFQVPSDRSDRNGYGRRFSQNYFQNDRTYRIEAFDVSATNTAKVVVVYPSLQLPSDPRSPVYVLTEPPRQEYNPAEDATMYRAEGVQINPSGPSDRFEEWVSAESESIAETLDAGTVFRAGTNIDGYLIIGGGDILYPSTRPFIKIADTVLSNPGWDAAEYTAVLGSVYAAEDDTVRIAIPSDGTFLESGDSIDINTVENVTITASDFSNAVVYYYDTTFSQPEMVELGAETAISWLTPYDDGLTDPSEVLFYMSEGKVKLFIVID